VLLTKEEHGELIVEAAAVSARVKPADELPFKTLAELMNDYFSSPEDDHVCSMESEVPKYFYYKGQSFKIDFTKLDAAHAQVLELKDKTGLVTPEAVALFHEIGIDHFDPTQEDLKFLEGMMDLEKTYNDQEVRGRHAGDEKAGMFGLKRLNKLMTDMHDLDEDFIWDLGMNGFTNKNE
jgi:hypothetical protein